MNNNKMLNKKREKDTKNKKKGNSYKSKNQQHFTTSFQSNKEMISSLTQQLPLDVILLSLFIQLKNYFLTKNTIL